MNTPEQAKSLATISCLAVSLEKKKLTNIQLDLLEIVCHLMTNISIQSMGLGDSSVALPPPEFYLGGSAEIRCNIGVEGSYTWQRTTIIDKRLLTAEGVTPEVYEYQTSWSKRGKWIGAEDLRKVAK